MFNKVMHASTPFSKTFLKGKTDYFIESYVAIGRNTPRQQNMPRGEEEGGS